MAMPNDNRGIGREAWGIALGVTLVRIAYLIAFCPYELAADEAQYWDWSRSQHLSLSYVTKGPGIAWLIAASTRLFGNSEWAIRLPAALSIGIAMLALAKLAKRIGGDDAARLTVLAFCCVPAYSAMALLMTIDAPHLACWVLACLCAWSLVERETTAKWLALAGCLGLGFLFKYTILLLVPGLAAWFWLERDRLQFTPRTLGRLTLALAFLALLASPVFLWNARNGWPTLLHLAGHLAGPRQYDPRWMLEFFGSQVGIVGPVLVLMVVGILRARTNRTESRDEWRVSRFALATASPILVFYLAVSCVARPEGNWPVAGYSTLLIPVALVARRVSRVLWRSSLAYGVLAFIALMSMHWLDRVPYLTRAIPYHRVSGHRAFAVRVAAIAEAKEAFVVASHYSDAALLGYYMPARPPVRSAGAFLEGRLTAYDFFADTSLRDPSLLGRPAVLVGGTADAWRRAFRFDAIRSDGPFLVGTNYRGPTAISLPPAAQAMTSPPRRTPG
jgi:4-amino-4-deoxy-L-arabinose transferase-like glycosyltransferase